MTNLCIEEIEKINNNECAFALTPEENFLHTKSFFFSK